jgi:hypothetical protein
MKLGRGESQNVFGLLRQLLVGHLAGVAKKLLEFPARKSVPTLYCNPVETCKIRGGRNAVILQQLVETLRTGEKRDYGASIVVEIHEGKHLAADGLVADPVDKVVAPLPGFFDKGKFAEKFPGSFNVHGEDYALFLSETNSAFRLCRVNRSTALRDFDLACRDESLGSIPDWLHQ